MKNEIRNKNLYLINVTDDNSHNKKQIENVFKRLFEIIKSNSFKEIKIENQLINKAFKFKNDEKGQQYFEQKSKELMKKIENKE